MLAALTLAVGTTGAGCSRRGGSKKAKEATTRTASGGPGIAAPPVAPRPIRPPLPALSAGEVYRYDDPKAATARKLSDDEARAGGLLVVDLGDLWAPFIFQDGGEAPARPVTGARPPANTAKDEGAKPNEYRKTFIDLANDRISADGRALDAAAGEHNFLEPFGIPPTLSVLRARVEREMATDRQACLAGVDREGLRNFDGNVAYLDREHARRDHAEAVRDAEWLEKEVARRQVTTAGGASGGVATTPPDAPAVVVASLRRDADVKVRTRAERALRGQERERAVRALQARLLCEGLLSAHSRFTAGMFDLPTHEALAEWERENDIFGWAALGGETLAALLRPTLELHFETFRRILAERIADAAGIVEDGSTSKWKTPPTYTDATAATNQQTARAQTAPAPTARASTGARVHPVPNLIEDHVGALLGSVHVVTPEDMVDFLQQHAAAGLTSLRVALPPPSLPPYYGPAMELSVEIDRGDVWYDFPFDARGRLVEQPRENYPHLTLFVHWGGQKIPLCWWRTTIGSWRSEVHANGKVYYRYKNSDVGPRVWKNIVAGPVWIPPDGTPAKDLLTRRVLDVHKGPEVVVNTQVMGPGFQSAYGLVMAIHINQQGFDNQIRTHGSVDYTSIARRFSHGCHRLVNNRAVRLFDFVLRRQPFRRIGSMPLGLKRNLVVDGKTYAFELKTRGYYYQLVKPIPVDVIEGRVMGQVKAPLVAYMRKAGVDYGGAEQPPGDGTGIRLPIPGVITPSGSGEVGASAGGSEGELSSPDTAAGLNVPDEPPTSVGP